LQRKDSEGITMADAIRLVSIKQGDDPRQCTLVVFGGAGPVHAAAIASELGIRRLLIPHVASVFCAAGMLLSDLKHDYVRTFSGDLAALDKAKVRALYEEMSSAALKTLADEGMQETPVTLSYAVDLKYVGQFHEVTIPFKSPTADFDQLAKDFAAQHKQLYGYQLPGQSVEALHWRLTALVRTRRPASFGTAPSRAKAKSSVKKKRNVIFAGRKIAADVYDGKSLGGRARFKGPAIIEEPTTTIVVPPGWRLTVNKFGDYEMLRNP
jgi:N-methylhydantoinase A